MTLKAYVNAHLIDGKGGRIDSGDLIVDGSKIIYVGPAKSFSRQDNMIVENVGGKTIMPGMMDAHTHHTCSSSPDSVVEAMQDCLPLRTLKSYLNFMKSLRAGFTTVRDVGAVGYIDIAVRTMIDSKAMIGPRVIAAGKAICQTGGHGAVCEIYPWTKVDYGGASVMADGEAEVVQAVRSQIWMGADIIKIFASSGIYDPITGKPRPEFTEKEIVAITSEAHAANKRVAAHCHSAEQAKICVRAKVDTIEHGVFLDDEALMMMADSGVFLVPTAVVYYNMSQGAGSGLMQSSIDNANLAVESHKKVIEKAVKYGVQIGIGTDSGTILTEHGCNGRELEILNSWGISAMDCICAATSVNSSLMGIDKVTGSLEEGKEADFLIVDGDPLKDISILGPGGKIIEVFKGGTPVRNVQ